MAHRADARGCLAANTIVATPNGPRTIQSLQPGDVVWSIHDLQFERATVVARFQVTADAVLFIRAGGSEVRATSEHPFQTAAGVFVEAGRLRPGDRIWLQRAGGLVPFPVESITASAVPQPAYNLMVSPNGTYLADGFVVHNKGCFLPDTPVLKYDGTSIPIAQVRVGDVVMAFTTEADPVPGASKQFLPTR